MLGDLLGGFLAPKVIEGDVDGYHNDVIVAEVTSGGKNGVAVVAASDVLAYLGDSEAFGFE